MGYLANPGDYLVLAKVHKALSLGHGQEVHELKKSVGYNLGIDRKNLMITVSWR